mmetsp:Transcript_101936/g.287699  ORF Transcript_101936/g.287699 Transcript_101936/m.287699 type:complete len:321 (-) Transcript_101936:187-1149(-)
MAVEPDDESLETCCVCLDSLSSAPVVVLLNHCDAKLARRACPHYLHSSCSELLYPQRCPLCRAAFVSLSEPIDVCRLRRTSPELIVSTLQRVTGALPLRPPTIPTRTVVELLAAVQPMPESALRAAALDGLGVDTLDVALREEDVSRLLEDVGIRPSRGVTSADGAMGSLKPGYSLATRLFRRLNWAMLKMSGALGASLFCGGCGMCAGVVAGGLVAVPQKHWPDFDGDNFVLAVKAAYLLCRAAYHGAQRTDLIGAGLRFGTSFGLIVGCFHGLVHVDPDNHGLWSVFLTSLTGQATLGGMGLLSPRRGSARRVEIFKS